MRRGERRAVVVLALVAAGCGLGGCEREERIIRYDPFLAGLPGAETGMAPVFEGGEPVDPSAATAEELRVVQPDGTVRLRARAIRHVMVHLAATLEAGEDDLLYDQVISAETKAHFESEGREPREAALGFLKQNATDVMALLARISAGERSPGARLEKVGARGFKLTYSGPGAASLRFVTFWVVIEEGQWRFWWVS